jgi:hypothetical protein
MHRIRFSSRPLPLVPIIHRIRIAAGRRQAATCEPTGTKPTIVTSVPVSIGNVVDV